MGQLDVDASNCCIPASYIQNLRLSFPPLPSTTRGEPVSLDGQAGRINNHRPMLAYASGKLIVVRELAPLQQQQQQQQQGQTILVYRGHTAPVSCVKFSPSGCYMASGDIRGKLRVWSLDSEEHLCKLDLTALAGPIHDIAWDIDSKRICIVGEGSKSDPQSLSSRIIQWDTGVSCGDLGQHSRKRTLSCSIKPNRPMRLVTSGPSEDPRCLFHEGPPFKRCTTSTTTQESEQAHIRGDIHCIRYNSDGSLIASVAGTDVCFYNGTTMELIRKMEKVHEGSIYSCAWGQGGGGQNGESLLTCSADGTVKRLDVHTFTIAQVWNLVGHRVPTSPTNRGMIPMGTMQMGCAFVQGNIPISVALNGEIHVLSSSCESSSTVSHCLSGHRSSISSLAIDRKAENIVYSGDADGIVCLWDLSARTAQRVLRMEPSSSLDGDRLHLGAISGMVLMDGHLLSVGWDDQLRWTIGKESTESLTLPAQPKKIIKGKKLLVILTCQGIILIKEGGTSISENFPISYEALCGCVSSDDSTLFIGGNDRTIHVYHVNKSADALTESFSLVQCHSQPITALRLSHDESKLASADSRDVCVWNVSERLSAIIPQGRWCFHRLRVNALAWSKNDSILASGSEDDSIYIWNLEQKMKRVHYPFAHRGGITEVDFLHSVDGMQLLSVGNDGCMNLWDITNDIKKTFSL